MSFNDIGDEELLSPLDVLRMTEEALTEERSFSLVRVGDGENIVLGQYTELSKEEFMNGYWMRQSKGDQAKGVRLPNLFLRSQMISAIKQADVVGVCRKENDEVSAPEAFKRPMTDRIFDAHNIRPSHLCHVFINRRIVEYPEFWMLLHQYRTLLISRWAKPFANLITQRYHKYKPQIVGCIDFSRYEQSAEVLTEVNRYNFDLVLISAGVNAVVMAAKIAQRYEAVALDFGKSMMFMIQDNHLARPWNPK